MNYKLILKFRGYINYIFAVYVSLSPAIIIQAIHVDWFKFPYIIVDLSGKERIHSLRKKSLYLILKYLVYEKISLLKPEVMPLTCI